MKSFIQAGNTIPLVAAAAVEGGQFVQQGAIVGLAVASASAGDPVEVALEGVYSAPKKAGEAWVVGDPLYYAPATKNLTKTSAAGLFLVAVALEAVASAATVGVARLNGAFQPAAA